MIFCTVVLIGTFLAVVAGATATRECRDAGGLYLARDSVCREAIIYRGLP